MVYAISLIECTLKMGISLAKNVTLPAVLKARSSELGSHPFSALAASFGDV